MAEFKVKYVIDADARKAKTEIRDVDAAFSKIGGALTSGPVGLGLAGIGTALLAVTAAAVTAGVALFDLSKSASEFGSEIFDATKKTGLSAESISAMKLAADQSGTSLEKITVGLAKFSKTVGDAGDGSKEAARDLEALGITPQEALNDLDGTLAKVLKRIQEAPPGIERMTLAQRAFGRSGADLLPFIDSFNGDLESLVKHAKALGVTLDDDTARAADEFGDTLDTLNAQLAGVGREIAFVFIPTFTRAMQAISQGLAASADDIAAWADRARMHILGVEQLLDRYADNLEEFRVRTGKSWGDIAKDLLDKTGPMIGRIDQLNQLISMGTAAQGLGKAIPGSPTEAAATTARISGVAPIGIRGGGGRGGKSPADTAADEERKRIAQVRKNLDAELALRAAKDRTRIAQLESFLAEGVISEQQAFERTQKIIGDQASFRIQAYNDTLALLKGNLEEEEKMRREIAIVEQQAYAESYRLIRDKAEFEKKIAKERLDEEMRIGGLVIERYEAEKKVADELERQADALREQRKALLLMPGYDARGNETTKAPRGGFSEGLFGPDGLNIIRDEAMQIEDIYRDMGSMVADVTMQMAQGVGTLIEAWVLYGDAGPQAVRKMVAAVLAGVAAEAATKAVFQLAEGFAALFFNPAEAAAHFKAAALYGAVAVTAGLAGRAIAGDSFSKGSNSRGDSSTSSVGGRSQQQQNQQPLTRQNGDTFISGRRSDPATLALARAVDKLETKISGMSPADVLVRGIARSPGTIGKALNDDIDRNSGYGTRLSRSLNIK